MASQRELAFRGLRLHLILAAAVCGFGVSAADRLPVLVVGLLWMAYAVVRARWRWRRLACRDLLVTPTHLVLRARDVVEQWVAWEDIDSLVVFCTTPPQWLSPIAGQMWFHVYPEPCTAMVPAQPVLSGFAEMLISSEDSMEAALRVKEAAEARGLSCRIT